MKKLELALCDINNEYITMFASYILGRNQSVNIHIFTTPESFFSDSSVFDLAIMSEEFDEVSYFKKDGRVKKKYVLCEEEPEESAENLIYKYQAVDEILSKIPQLIFSVSKKASTNNSNIKSNMVGIYSPNSHELQLPFAMAISKSLSERGRVLFLDLEELSVLNELIGVKCDKNLMDLLYEIGTADGNMNIEDYIHHFLGIDYINPFINPNEISEIEMESWKNLFCQLEKLNYDSIVILFGRTINGFSEILDNIAKMYILGKPGDYFKKGQEQFVDYLERLSKKIAYKKVLLPMSASNLSEGTYCIEELLQGHLGMFVKKVLKEEELEMAMANG